MRIVSKLLTIFSLVVMSIACQDGKMDAVDSAHDKHDNARTTYTFTDVSGTMTVPAGTYDVIRIAGNSNITLANGVKFNFFEYTGVNINITIGTGDLVVHYQDVWLPTGTTFTNYGTLRSKADFLIGVATFNNIGTHTIEQTLVLDMNATYNESLLASFTAWRIWVREPGAKFNFNNTSIFLPNITLTTLLVSPQVSSSDAAFFGKGKITTAGGTIRYMPLAGSSTIKVCTSVPFTFSDGGTLGLGSYSC